MNMAAQVAISKLIDEDINYQLSGDDDEIIEMVFSGDNIKDLFVGGIFDKDEEDFLIYVNDYCTVPEDKTKSILSVLNELNDEFRWVKFYIDNDREICVETDAIIHPETCGEIFLTLVRRIVDICDQAYPELMKHIKN